jgi:hypothetical protein
MTRTPGFEEADWMTRTLQDENGSRHTTFPNSGISDENDPMWLGTEELGPE